MNATPQLWKGSPPPAIRDVWLVTDWDRDVPDSLKRKGVMRCGPEFLNEFSLTDEDLVIIDIAVANRISCDLQYCTVRLFDGGELK